MPKRFSEQGGGKADIQAAILELRKILDVSQQGLATLLSLPVATVTRWESSRPPRGVHLAKLHSFAREASDQHPSLIPIANFLSRAMDRKTKSRDLTIQQSIIMDSFIDLLRERHLDEVRLQCNIAIQAIEDGYKALLKYEESGRILFIKPEVAKEQFASLKSELLKDSNNRVQPGDWLRQESKQPNG